MRDGGYAGHAIAIVCDCCVCRSLGGGDPSDSIFQAATLALQGGQSTSEH